jgi:hypothetical protein
MLPLLPNNLVQRILAVGILVALVAIPLVSTRMPW